MSYVCVWLTWEVVHETGLGRYDPLRSRLTEDGNVFQRFLSKSNQTAAESSHFFIHLIIRHPAILSQNHLQRNTKGLKCFIFCSAALRGKETIAHLFCSVLPINFSPSLDQTLQFYRSTAPPIGSLFIGFIGIIFYIFKL